MDDSAPVYSSEVSSALEHDSLIVNELLEGQRLDKGLHLYFDKHSRSYFQKLIDEGLVLVNGSSVKKRTVLKIGDEIDVQFALNEECDIQPENIPLDVLYEDEYLLAINKPAGLVVHPAPGNWTGTFVNALLYHCQNLKADRDNVRPGIVHRLDKDTSGVLLAAKTLQVQHLLVQQFAERKVSKKYLTVCVGKSAERGVINQPIGRHPKERKLMAITDSGRNAITHFHRLYTDGTLSVLDIDLETGRTHQIRVHLQSIGCPVLGDASYGSTQANHRYKVKRQLLHAHQLSFIHPITEKPMSITAHPPQDMVEWIEKIKKRDPFLDS